MPREPRVRLDRERVGAQRLLAPLDRVGEPLAVALGRQVAAELVDEQAAVREDQHAEVARRLDEPGGGDRLAGRGGVAEAVAARGAGVLAGEAGLLGLLVASLGEVDVLLVLVLLDELRDAAVARSRCRSPRRSAGSRRSARSASPQRVDLVAAEGGPGGGRRRLARRARARGRASGRSAPSSRGDGVRLPASISSSASSSASRRAVPGASATSGSSPAMEERLAGPALGADARRPPGPRTLRRTTWSDDRGFLHVRSSLETRRSVLRNRSRKAAHSGVVRAPASLHP